MEENRGYLGANTYALPTVAPEPVSQINQQPYDDGVQALQGLQYVKGQTEAYYKKVADLKSFMQGAHANLGVDVRVPDMSKPESIKLHQIYNDAITDILRTGNSLKNSHGIESQLTNMRAQYAPGVDPKAQSADKLVQGKDYWFGLQDLVKENNDFQQQAHDSGNIEEATQKFEETKNYLESQKDGSNNAAIDYQIKGLIPPRSVKDRTFAPARTSWQERSWGKKVDAAGSILKKTVNLLTGAHDSYVADSTDLTPEGIPYLKSNEFLGKKVGNSEVSYWRLNPITKQVDIVLKNGEIVDAASQDGLGLASNLGGANADALAEYASKNDIADEYGQVDKNKLLGADYNKLLENHSKTATKALAVRQKTEETINGALSKLTNLGKDSKTVLNLPKIRTKVTVEKGIFGKYYIKNFKDSFLRPKDKKDATATQKYRNEFNKFDYDSGEGATLEEIQDFLFKKSLPEVDNMPKGVVTPQPETKSGTEVAPTKTTLTKGGLD